ncbi:G-type lectin S-receptor-like serine/threonine-protein kinase At4g27290 isoform X2 [Salvia miltiorrhiza]|uniref:G-type lectin S-receptor-like serine/threonine-protein kinase At4g27290 isoform X2 n=1 Tax=Salvia miltiorrhiza TaxID=226208 RepID=UPI0025ACF89E|nr:G-type lectin S-receptor-like serine/threonine-protein kinase At4g27290 isoform X2 [Salvia miltiorrhiza]
MFNRILFNLFLFVTFLKFSDAADTLFPNETIGVGQTLVSQNQVFEVGFFTPGAPGNSFLGMWYKNTPKVVIWVANRNDPITDSGVVLKISEYGNLSISTGRRVVWSGNPSGVASDPVLKLLDTGNLVVAADTTKQGYIWQSFDYPTDNWLPGMKLVDDSDSGVEKYLRSWKNLEDPSGGEFSYRIENQGLPELVVYRETTKMFRTGSWNGLYFGGLPPLPNGSVTDYSFRDERLIYVARPISSSIFSRTTLESSGLLQRYNMNERKDAWNHVQTYPRDKCDEYGNCGAYALCSTEKPQMCECFKGFAPKSQHEWDIQDWSGGCTRTTPLNCSNGDGFLEIRGVKYPDMLRFWLNTSMSLEECKAECLKNCNCTACANPYITNGDSGCVMWYGDLIDIRQFPEADDRQTIYLRLPASELGSASNGEKEKEEKKSGAKKLVVIFISSGVLILALFGGGVVFIIKRRREASKSDDADIELKIFKLETIVAATNNFSWENMIGEGGFGPVYKGILSAEGEIAVKRLSRTSQQGTKEFKNEVILIAKLQHRNLVRLLGCCIEGEERMLIYEYLQNKSLDYFVFDQNRRKLLTWPMRFDIIMGIARGLLYLHQDSRLKIIHRDLKTSNILLDRDLNPKISDFGLARIFGEGQSIATTRRVVGTYGYMAPEYAVYGKYSVKSDVFALGVILLEIVSGRKNRDFGHSDDDHSLLGHAWFLWGENKIPELMDKCLSDTSIESQVKRCIHVGLLCVQKFAEDRPIMSSVVFMLGNDEAIIPKPKEPGFFPEESWSCQRSACQESITFTDLEAR